MTEARSLGLQTVFQLVISLALLAFAALETDPDDGLRAVIVTGVITNWFKESSAIGRQVADARAARQDGG